MVCPYNKTSYPASRRAPTRSSSYLGGESGETDHLDRLAEFLADVPAGWDAGTQEQRNKLAHALVDEVWVEDKTVVAVKPRAELEPFFRLNYEEFARENLERAGLSRA